MSVKDEFIENEDGEVFHVTANDVWKVDEDEEIIDDEADLTDLGVIEQHG